MAPLDPTQIYTPGDSFREMDKFPQLVEDVASENTELWLVQLPVGQLGPKDLMEKQWSMLPLDSDNKLGHFYNSRGNMFDVVEDKLERRKLYAILPDATDYSVRRITRKICLRRHIELQKEVSAVGLSKSAVTMPDSKSKAGSTATTNKRTLLDEKQPSAMTEDSVGNKGEVEDGKKKRKKKKKSRSKESA